MPQLIASIAVQATVTIGVALIQRALAPKPKARQAVDLAPSAPKPATLALGAPPDAGGPLPGIFGNRRVGGRTILSAKSGDRTFVGILIAGFPVTAINAVYFNNQLVGVDGSDRVTDSPWASGSDYSARVKMYDGTQTTADPWLVAAFPGWTADHVGYECAYAIIEIDPSVNPGVFNDVYGAGIPDFTFNVSGFECYDPRNGAHAIGDSATWTYSANAAIIKANYLIHELGAAIPTSDIDWDSVTSAANVCDELVPLAGGGAESRYRCAAFWTTDERHEAVLARMNAADAGGVHLVGQKWRVYSGGFSSPAVTWTPSDYAGDDGLSWSDAPPLDQSVNGARGRFSSPEHYFEDRDFPPYQDAAAVTADGRESWADLDLAYVTSHTQAQRLAKIALNRARYGYGARVSVGFGHFDIVANDVVAITDPLAGFDAETFRVVGESLGSDFMLDFDLEHETSDTWAWDETTDEREFTVGGPLSGDGSGGSQEAGPPLPPGAWLTTEYVSGAGAFETYRVWLHFWDSPTPGVDQYDYVWAQNAVNSFVAAGPGPANLGTFGVNVSIQDVSIRATNTSTGESGDYVSLTPAANAASIAGQIESNATVTALPIPKTPTVTGLGGGSATVEVDEIDGAQSAFIELWEHTANDFSAATLIDTTANGASGASVAVSGTVGNSKFYWARTKNAAGTKFSGKSRALIVVF